MLRKENRTPLAEGSYGCIYTEDTAPPCEANSGPKGRKVRKLLKKEDASVELTISKLIKSIPLWEYYFVVQEETGCVEKNFKKARPMYEEFCKIYKSSQNKNLTEIVSPFRGVALRTLTITDSFSYIESFQHILTGLSALHKQGICHADIHAGNILEENGYLRLIDFGSSFLGDSINATGVERYNYSFTPDFPTQPPELSLQNGINHGLDIHYCVDELVKHRIVFRNGSVTGITPAYARNKLLLAAGAIGTTKAQWVEYYKKHWRKFDTWSLGVVFYNVLQKSLFLRSFQPIWKKNQAMLMTVLRGCLEPDPSCRFSADEALSYFHGSAV